MPFMHNKGAVARTLEYLQKGEVYLEKNVRIMMFSFNYDKVAKVPAPRHKGLYNYVFWHVPQLQYKNPQVQILTFNKISPIPWIRIYCGDDKKVDIDCDGRSREEIFNHIKTLFGMKEKDEIAEAIKKKIKNNHFLANFGEDCMRHCMCEVPGQVPCTSFQRIHKKNPEETQD